MESAKESIFTKRVPFGEFFCFLRVNPAHQSAVKSPVGRYCQLPNRPGPTSGAADHLSLRVRELQRDGVVEMMTTTIWRNCVGYRDLRAEMALVQRAHEGVSSVSCDTLRSRSGRQLLCIEAGETV